MMIVAVDAPQTANMALIIQAIVIIVILAAVFFAQRHTQ